MAAFPRANVSLPGKRSIIRYQFSSLLQPHVTCAFYFWTSQVPACPKLPSFLILISLPRKLMLVSWRPVISLVLQYVILVIFLLFFLEIFITICVTICLCCSLYGMIISSISHCLDVRITVPTLFPLLNFLPLHHSTLPFFYSTFLSFCFASFLVCLASSVSNWYFCIISHYSSTSLMISLPTNPSLFVEN